MPRPLYTGVAHVTIAESPRADPVHREASMVAAVVLIRAEREFIPSAAREVAGIEGVAEVYSVSGDWDLVAIVRVPQWEQIADVVADKLAKVPGLERTYTLVAFRVYSRQDLDSAYDMFE